MAEISVERAGNAYRVTIADAAATFVVTIPSGYPARLGLSHVTPEELLRASFEFLLAREPASSILARFELPVIERYFPEYPREIARALG
jgi:hypothetical protein